jgi:DNA-binding transcriptional MerR regulator
MKATRPKGAMTTGKLAAATGVSPDTIRHYEQLGLLSTALRTAGGYRLFPSDALTHVRMIRAGLHAGFSLAELAGIFRERAAGGAPCRRVANLASEKVRSLDRQIAQLTQLRDWLSQTVAAWQQRLNRTPLGQRAGLLESLAREQPNVDPRKETAHENRHPPLSPFPHRRLLRTKSHGVPHAAGARRG